MAWDGLDFSPQDTRKVHAIHTNKTHKTQVTVMLVSITLMKEFPSNIGIAEVIYFLYCLFGRRLFFVWDIALISLKH